MDADQHGFNFVGSGLFVAHAVGEVLPGRRQIHIYFANAGGEQRCVAAL
jgi:hypothetical protein